VADGEAPADPLERIAAQLETLPQQLADELKRAQRPRRGLYTGLNEAMLEAITGTTAEDRKAMAEWARTERAERRAEWATRAAVISSACAVASTAALLVSLILG
jgi:hypothetical protein